MWVYRMAKALGWPAMYWTFSINHLSYTKTLAPIYIFRAITFLWWCRHCLNKNGLFAPKVKKTLSWAVFLEALIVALPFLDMFLDIFGAWINKNKSFDWDIILENIALFANSVFLNTKSWSWIMLGVVMNVLCFVLMICWNQHMTSFEMYIFGVDVVLITCWNILMAWLFWVGMHQGCLSIPASGTTHI